MYTWMKTARYNEAYNIHDLLLNNYGPEYTNGWYSVRYVCNGCTNFKFIVHSSRDDKTMPSLGFKLIGPKDETL